MHPFPCERIPSWESIKHGSLHPRSPGGSVFNDAPVMLLLNLIIQLQPHTHPLAHSLRSLPPGCLCRRARSCLGHSAALGRRFISPRPFPALPRLSPKGPPLAWRVSG